MYRKAAAVVLLSTALLLSGCSQKAETAKSEASAPASAKKVTIVTHDSFKISDALKAQFEKESGEKLEILSPSSAAALVNQLILTKDSPVADGVFGIDNVLASKAIQAGILSPYLSKNIPASAAKIGDALNPIDFGDVCVNADKKYFEDKKIPLPKTLDDLLKPEYKDMLVTENAASSSPGLAFLIATVGAKGESGYVDYWKKLKANGVKVVKGWTQAYTKEFSAGEGKGKYPLVVSYGASPAAEVNKEGTESKTVSLPDTCFRQTEYAAVLKGAKNPEGAKKFIDFMLGKAFQESIPDNMYMYPINPDAKVPENWSKFAQPSKSVITVAPDEINKNRDNWVKEWDKVVNG